MAPRGQSPGVFGGCTDMWCDCHTVDCAGFGLPFISIRLWRCRVKSIRLHSRTESTVNVTTIACIVCTLLADVLAFVGL